jgi:predicted RNase H-like HicB family nuclease
MRQVILIPDEDGVGYTVEVPTLPGCYSQGDTLEEALTNIREAIEGYIEALEADDLPVPPVKSV